MAWMNEPVGRGWIPIFGGSSASATMAVSVSSASRSRSSRSGIAAMTLQFSRFLDACGPSQHLLGSIQVTVEGDTGLSRAYVQARHQGKGDKAHLYLDSNGEYIDRWERRPQGWRIVRRDVNWHMNMGDVSVLGATP